MQVPADVQRLYQSSNALVPAVKIDPVLEQLAAEITADLSDSNPILLTVMIGALVFSGQLLTKLAFPLQLDYVHASRYRGKTVGNQIEWLHKPHIALSNRHVLILDDVLDGGLTLQAIADFCRAQGAASVRTAVLIDKPTTRVAGGLKQADYVGISLPDEYIYGYGMDYHEYCRNLAAIYGVDVNHG